MANPTTSRTTKQARDAKCVVGIGKRLQNVQSIVLGGVSYTPTTLSALFQSAVDSANAVTTAHGQWISATQSDAALNAKVNLVWTALQAFVRQMFNNAPDALADFGFTAKKTTASTTSIKVVAVAKRAATRTARHTLGSKERLTIKGTLTGPVVVSTGTSTSAAPAATTPGSAEAAPALAATTPAGAAPPGAGNGPPPKPPIA